MKKKSNILTFFLVIFFTLFAFGAKADIIFNNPSGIKNVNAAVVNIVNWLLGITSAVAILFLVYGGVVYATSLGDDRKMEEGKQIVTYAILGLFVVLISYSIVLTLNNIIFG